MFFGDHFAERRRELAQDLRGELHGRREGGQARQADAARELDVVNEDVERRFRQVAVQSRKRFAKFQHILRDQPIPLLISKKSQKEEKVKEGTGRRF